MRSFFETLPKRIAQIILTILTILTIDNISHNTLDTPKLSTDQIILCDIELTEKDLYDSMKTMENDICLKRNFRDNIKVIFISSIKQVRERKELNISQRQL